MSGDLSSIYYPSLVSSSEERIVVLEKLEKISGHLRTLFFSDELVALIEDFSLKHSLHDDQIADISRGIRALFFGEVSEEGFARNVVKITGQDLSVGARLVQDIKNVKVAEKTEGVRDSSSTTLRSAQNNTGQDGVIKRTGERGTHLHQHKGEVSEGQKGSLTPQNVAQLTLAAALEKYPTLAKQKVTSELLVAKPSLTPLAPNVGNWLTLYERAMGADKHDDVVRGDFLYRAPACRGLRRMGRARLAELLRARDEDTLLTVDVETGHIVWNDTVPTAPPRVTHTQPTSQVVEVDRTQHTHQSQSQTKTQPATTQPPTQATTTPQIAESLSPRVTPATAPSQSTAMSTPTQKAAPRERIVHHSAPSVPRTTKPLRHQPTHYGNDPITASDTLEEKTVSDPLTHTTQNIVPPTRTPLPRTHVPTQTQEKNTLREDSRLRRSDTPLARREPVASTSSMVSPHKPRVIPQADVTPQKSASPQASIQPERETLQSVSLPHHKPIDTSMYGRTFMRPITKDLEPHNHTQPPQPRSPQKPETASQQPAQEHHTPPQKPVRWAQSPPQQKTVTPHAQRAPLATPTQNLGTTVTPAPQQTQKPLEKRVPAPHNIPTVKSQQTIPSLDQLRGQKTAPTQISPQHFTQQPPVQKSDFTSAPVAKNTPEKKVDRGAKLPTPQARKILPQSPQATAKEKLDRLMRSATPYTETVNKEQTRSPQQPVQKPAKKVAAQNIAFTSGHMLPAEKEDTTNPPQRTPYHIHPIRKN